MWRSNEYTTQIFEVGNNTSVRLPRRPDNSVIGFLQGNDESTLLLNNLSKRADWLRLELEHQEVAPLIAEKTALRENRLPESEMGLSKSWVSAYHEADLVDVPGKTPEVKIENVSTPVTSQKELRAEQIKAALEKIMNLALTAGGTATISLLVYLGGGAFTRNAFHLDQLTSMSPETVQHVAALIETVAVDLGAVSVIAHLAHGKDTGPRSLVRFFGNSVRRVWTGAKDIVTEMAIPTRENPSLQNRKV